MYHKNSELCSNALMLSLSLVSRAGIGIWLCVLDLRKSRPFFSWPGVACLQRFINPIKLFMNFVFDLDGIKSNITTPNWHVGCELVI